MTHSSKGWLLPRGPNEPPRLTQQQQIAILEALAAVRDHEIRRGLTAVERCGLTYAETVIASALERYPGDRSCHTCDFYQGATCAHWQQEVPGDALDAGCDQHQTDGAPF